MNSAAVLLFAVGLFFLTGVVSLFKQGIKVLAVVCLVLAALAFTGGALRL